ncbi:MAG: hypothetical protein ACQEXJ_23435 [Myxococcota bacterium]
MTTTGVHLHKQDPATWSDDHSVEWVDDALVVVTQAYCHNGHELVDPSNPTFGGYPGLRVRVTTSDRDEDVTLSPIHGHREKSGGEDIAPGTRCRIACPTCDEPLPEYAACPCDSGTLHAISLSADPRKGHLAAVCDVWGCPHSRVVDEFEVLSEIIDAETAEGVPA